ncbi:hypothetical protein BDZ94DRAFT_1315015 [Collybia nuda]|uniref:Uncharacterized protein n=1 Tax=Collybia nuda TaxID=64659 RepID=A0A9P5XVQ1_9AGAR|nr:hypothetical protein BDZ94DRAFT_1315015 [Collybia nuda]
MTTQPASTKYTVTELLDALAALHLTVTRNSTGDIVIAPASVAALTSAFAAVALSTPGLAPASAVAAAPVLAPEQPEAIPAPSPVVPPVTAPSVTVSVVEAPTPTPTPAPTLAPTPTPTPALSPVTASAGGAVAPFIADRLPNHPGGGKIYYAITVGRRIGVFIGTHYMHLASGVSGGTGHGFKDYDQAVQHFTDAYNQGLAYVV